MPVRLSLAQTLHRNKVAAGTDAHKGTLFKQNYLGSSDNSNTMNFNGKFHSKPTGFEFYTIEEVQNSEISSFSAESIKNKPQRLTVKKAKKGLSYRNITTDCLTVKAIDFTVRNKEKGEAKRVGSTLNDSKKQGSVRKTSLKENLMLRQMKSRSVKLYDEVNALNAKRGSKAGRRFKGIQGKKFMIKTKPLKKPLN